MGLERLPPKFRKYDQTSSQANLVNFASCTTKLRSKPGGKTGGQTEACAKPAANRASGSSKIVDNSEAASAVLTPGQCLISTLRTLLHVASTPDEAHPATTEQVKKSKKGKRAPAQKKKTKQTKSGQVKGTNVEALPTASSELQVDLPNPPNLKSGSKKRSKTAAPKDAVVARPQLQQGAERTNQQPSTAASPEATETKPKAGEKGDMTRSRSKRLREAAEDDAENDMYQMLDDPERKLRKIPRRK